MNELMKFENTPIDIQEVNGVLMLDLYAVGAALGYVRDNGYTAKSDCEHGVHKLYPYKSRIDKVCKNAEITPVLRNAKPYITESQLYDFMLEARTDKCRAFRKWLTNEVLPTLRQTGTYTIGQDAVQLELNHEQPEAPKEKKYRGEVVMTVNDIAKLTDINKQTIRDYFNNNGTIPFDYQVLRGEELHRFKRENNLRSTGNALMITRKRGFKALCKYFGIDIAEPHEQSKLTEKKPHPILQQPSDSMVRLIGYIDRETETIRAAAKMLLSTDTKENHEVYRNALLRHMNRLRGYNDDVKAIMI